MKRGPSMNRSVKNKPGATDLAWAAGFIEGEGSFLNSGKSISVQAGQVQRWPLEKLQDMFGGGIYFIKRRSERHQNQYKWNTSGERAAGIAFTLYQLLSPRRKEQARKALHFWLQSKCHYRVRSECKHGHPYDAANTYILTRKSGNQAGKKSRRCRICQSKRKTARRKRLAA